MDWKSRLSTGWKQYLINERWPGLLNRKLQPPNHYWYYLLPFDEPRSRSDMEVVFGLFFMKSFAATVAELRRELSEADEEPTDEAILTLIEQRYTWRSSHFEYTPGRGRRCFQVVGNPDLPSLELTLRGHFCPLYLVVVNKNPIGESVAGEPDPFINFFLRAREPIARRPPSDAPPVRPVGGTLVAQGDEAMPQGTRLGEMLEHPANRLRTGDIAPLKTNDPLAKEPPKPTFFERNGLYLLFATIGLIAIALILIFKPY